MPNEQHSISKSQYLRGLQCPKSLWLYRHRKDLAPDISDSQQALFDTGEKIGKLAQRYFDAGIEVTNEYWDIDGAIDATKGFIKSGQSVIFEATAKNPINGCYSRIDVLKKVEGIDEWDLIEAKSSTSVKDYHIDDMSFQYHVFHGAGYKIRKCFMMVIDNTYVRMGDLDEKLLFKLEDITPLVITKQAEVEVIAGQLGYLLEQQKTPEITIGSRCSKPFECDYKSHCWAHVPDYSIYNIFTNSKADEIAKHHGYKIENIPENIRPNGAKNIDIESYLSGCVFVNKEAIKAFLSTIKYPLYFLDYETIMPSLPIFDGTRPFHQIPFQFSLHIQNQENDDLSHFEFLHKDQTDPREMFIKSLVNLCGQKGSIIVYNQAFESARNNELARDFPEYAKAIQNINQRMVDLLIPFKSRWLYHPSQKSSASIKAVLPAFTDLSYNNMEIGNGGQAMQQYGAFLAGKFSEKEQLNLWRNLSLYCAQDTYAMVKLLITLEKYTHNI